MGSRTSGLTLIVGCDNMAKNSITYFEAFEELGDALKTLKMVCMRELVDLFTGENAKRDAEVKACNFMYCIVDLDTNVRKTEDGVPVIYSTIETAEYYCSEEFDRVISIAEYNRRYGEFMADVVI